MRNPLTIRVETRYGISVIICWAVIFLVVIFRALSSFSDFLMLMHVTTPLSKSAVRVAYNNIDRWLADKDLNSYGDPQGTAYATDPPLVDEVTGQVVGRYTYLIQKFPNRPWLEKSEARNPKQPSL